MKGFMRQPKGCAKDYWELVVELPRDPITGKRQRQYHTFRGNKTKAQARLTELTDAANKGNLARAPKTLTIEDFLREWVSGHIKLTVAPKTFERMTREVENHLIPRIGRIPLRDLKTEEVTAFYVYLTTEGRVDGKGGLDPISIRNVHRTLHQALTHAIDLNKITSNPATKATKPRVAKRRAKVLDEGQMAKLLGAAKGTHMFAPLLVALTTGVRRGELLALPWSAVDLDTGRIRIEQSVEQLPADGDGPRVRIKPPKTESSRRTIALPAIAVETLKRHRVEQIEQRMALGLGRAELVFTEIDGAMIVPDVFTHRLTRLAASVGLKCSPHTLRHTMATALLKAGQHVKIVAERLGHSSITMTLDTYSHVLPDMQEEAAAAMNEIMNGVVEK